MTLTCGTCGTDMEAADGATSVTCTGCHLTAQLR